MRQLEVERPVLRYFGGKWMLAPWIIEHFPPHRIYIEPFGGGASVLLQKEPAQIEVYNDLDGEIVNVFRVLRDPELSAKLAHALKFTPYSRDEFNLSYEKCCDPVEWARRTIARAYMGVGSNGHNSDERTGFRAVVTARNTSNSDTFSRHHDHVESFHKRLRLAVIENRDALELMPQQDAEDALFFVDPPYVHSTRTITKGYRFEMDDAAHERLCDCLASLKGMVILCGYENPVYDRLGWAKVTGKGRRDSAARGSQVSTEVLWINDAAIKAQSQQSLFASTPKDSQKGDK